MTLAGFPHSGISGSRPTCGSPKLIAAYHALPRLSVPRHPPCALRSLDRIISSRSPASPSTRYATSHTHRCTRVHYALGFITLTHPHDPCCQSTRLGGCFVQDARPVSLSVPGGTYSRLQKGGDPAAGSPTATLLRLRPSHRARLRPLPPLRVGRRTSGAHSFHGVTGGVYKARERIHRGVADPRLLAIPASCSRVTDCNPNLDRLFPIRSASRPRFGLYRPL